MARGNPELAGGMKSAVSVPLRVQTAMAPFASLIPMVDGSEPRCNTMCTPAIGVPPATSAVAVTCMPLSTISGWGSDVDAPLNKMGA